ncbi:MAG: hypothetical protein SFZ23_03315 [Planctomycetota bacterium]|nr:hypothetical protein [Planctomycetota bacterium]
MIHTIARLDPLITLWMARNGPRLLRVSLGIVFLWFGAIKFVPGLSPADELATRTISTLTLGIVPAEVSRPSLALWETLIGIGLISGMFLRATILLLALQMFGTVTPLVLFPGETWHRFPVALTLEGQYIVKNIVLVTAGIVVGATVRGGAMVSTGRVAAQALVDDAREVASEVAVNKRGARTPSVS